MVMIITAALVLFILFCLSLGLSRSWNDETQAERNALVFADRNREYGAYRLREDYGNRVGVAMLASVGALCTAVVVVTAIAHIGWHPVADVPHPVVVDIDLGRVVDPPPMPPKPTDPAMAAALPPVKPDPEKPRVVEVVNIPVVPPAYRTDSNQTAPGPTGLPGGGGTGVDPDPGGSPGTGPGSNWGTTVVEVFEVQEVPQFPGGEAAMGEWVRRNLDFPADGAAKDVIYVQFTVGLDGSVEDVHAVKGKQATYRNAAERTVRRMPRWTPARMNGHDVRCRLTLPIRFETR